MLKILVEKWEKNRDELYSVLSKKKDINSCGYTDLVKLTFNIIFNDNKTETKLDVESIVEVDQGDYQGTLLYLIPFSTYQPSEYDYLMTYVGYGSCSGCDTLQGIQVGSYEQLATPGQLNDFMILCKDIVTNTIKPYNSGWRENDDFEQAVV